MAALLLTGGRVIDPGSGLDTVTDLLIQEGRIAAIGSDARAQAPENVETWSVDGLVVSPGLIDSHVHLREPGQTRKETIETGTIAAARGGFTSVVCMPNTSPVIDNAGIVALIREKADKVGHVHVHITGTISQGLAGEQLAPLGSLKQAGVVAITDDGRCIQNNDLMRRALEYARMFKLPLLDHCQDSALTEGGVMHEGYWSTVLGLKGWPAIGEETIVMRNILLAELTGAWIHCQHIGTAGSVRLLREAQQRQVPISGEACPHHFTLTDEAISGSDRFWQGDGSGIHGWERLCEQAPPWPSYDTNLKMNPPLRSASDRAALCEGVRDGTIEIIGSDHAPHSDFEKEVEFDESPFGVTGLETELSLALSQFYHSGRLTLPELLKKLTTNPARILGLAKGHLEVGADADITLIDPDKRWVFDAANRGSKALNSPFNGWELQGKAIATIVSGNIAWSDAEWVSG